MNCASALLWAVSALLWGPAAAPLAVAGPIGEGRPPAASPGGTKVFLSQEEALELAFQECDVTRVVIALTDAERKQAGELAGKDVDVDQRVVYAYEARRDGKLVGTAYFDSHRVRSLNEVLMFVVDADERIARLEMLSFSEPEEYIPRAKWYAQFAGKRLDDDLRLKGDIKSVTGATLTAVATTGAARRTLALHAVIAKREKKGDPPPKSAPLAR